MTNRPMSFIIIEKVYPNQSDSITFLPHCHFHWQSPTVTPLFSSSKFFFPHGPTVYYTTPSTRCCLLYYFLSHHSSSLIPFHKRNIRYDKSNFWKRIYPGVQALPKHESRVHSSDFTNHATFLSHPVDRLAEIEFTMAWRHIRYYWPMCFVRC